jgi:hypothetical protein
MIEGDEKLLSCGDTEEKDRGEKHFPSRRSEGDNEAMITVKLIIVTLVCALGVGI